MKYQIKDRAGHKELWVLQVGQKQWIFVARRNTAAEILRLINA